MKKNKLQVYFRHISRSGFTLVELMIVIVVIGILAGITTASYNGAQQRARDTSILSDIEMMDVAQTSYQTHTDEPGLPYNSKIDDGDELGFSPSPGNVIDVVVGDEDYCIRGYNPSARKNSITNSFQKESKKGTCALLPPSPGA